MTLCEALDWCREHQAFVRFTRGSTTLQLVGGSTFTSPTLEGVVEQAICNQALPGQTFTEASKNNPAIMDQKVGVPIGRIQANFENGVYDVHVSENKELSPDWAS